jgi:hypothetical protein
MKKRFHYAALLSASLSLLIGAACEGANRPSPAETVVPPAEVKITPAEKTSYQPTPMPSETVSQGPTDTPVETIISNGYELVDWREPVDVITQENMNRVERLGQLKFISTVSSLAWSPEGEKLAIASESGLFIMDSSSFNKIYQINSVNPYLIVFNTDGKILHIGLPYVDITTGEIINRNL